MGDIELPEFTIEELEELASVDLGPFGNDDAVDLGLCVVEVITERGLNLAVDIVLRDDLVFRARFGTTGPGNDRWLRGKAATAVHFEEPSLLARLRAEASGKTAVDFGLDPETHAFYGGSIPLRSEGAIVGTLTVSGEPDVVDHDVVAQALRRYISHDS